MVAASLILLVFTMFQSFLTTGIIYGWPAFLLMLRSEGVYRDRCSIDTTDDDCRSRVVAFNFVFTLGTVINVAGSLAFGRTVDLLGPKRSILIGVTITILGSCIVAFAPVESNVAWPAAYIAYGLGGMIIHLPSFSLGNVFGQAKGLVVSILVATFSLSCLTFQVMQLAYEHGGYSRRVVFCGHAALVAINFLVSLWLWPHQPLQTGDRLEFARCGLRVVFHNSANSAPQGGSASLRDSCGAAVSLLFMKFSAFHAVQMSVSRWLMGWMSALITWKDEQILEGGGQALNRDMHLSIFNSCQAFLGISAIPVFAWIAAKTSHRVAPFIITNLIAVLTLAFMLVPAEWALYFVYVFGGWHRQFIFSTFFTFLISEFPLRSFATLAGISSFVAGALSYLQNPILDIVLGPLGGDFSIPFAIQLILAVLLFGFPFAEWFKLRQERCKAIEAAPVAKEENCSESSTVTAI